MIKQILVDHVDYLTGAVDSAVLATPMGQTKVILEIVMQTREIKAEGSLALNLKENLLSMPILKGIEESHKNHVDEMKQVLLEQDRKIKKLMKYKDWYDLQIVLNNKVINSEFEGELK